MIEIMHSGQFVKPRHSAKIMPTIETFFHLDPRLETPVGPCHGAIMPEMMSGVATVAAADLKSHVVVPVRRIVPDTALSQITAPNWNRELIIEDENQLPCFHPPILLSARANWTMQDGHISVFDRAVVLDGARRLELALRIHQPKHVPIIVTFGMNTSDENALRERISSNSSQIQVVHDAVAIGTLTPRLRIGEDWVDLEICTDPFLVATRNGYVAALVVDRTVTLQHEHILIGARSLALPLEEMRVNRGGTLLGLKLSLRKSGPEKMSPYELRLTTHPAGETT